MCESCCVEVFDHLDGELERWGNGREGRISAIETIETFLDDEESES